MDVAAANRDVVDVVSRVAVARQHALDRELGVLAPLAADAPGAVVEDELDRRAADRLALAGAVEDDVLHRLAAQRGRLRFAQHPANGVDDVRLAAAVGTDDADELAGRADRRGVHERLEPGELDLGEAQLRTGERMSGGLSERPGQRRRHSPRAGRAPHLTRFRSIRKDANYSRFARVPALAPRRSLDRDATGAMATSILPSSTAWHATSPPPGAGSSSGRSVRQRSSA